MEGPPADLNLSETQIPRILGINIATFAIAIISVVLRFVSRQLSSAQLWWDDWLIVSALVCYLTLKVDWMIINHDAGFYQYASLCNADL